MDLFDELIARAIPRTPKSKSKSPSRSPNYLELDAEELQDPLKKRKVIAYGEERKETFPHRRKRLPSCPCKPSEQSDSCGDGRYLTKLMTSKDILFPPQDDISIKPTESEILARFTPKQIAEYRDAFDYFDLECKGYILASYVSSKLRTLNETAILPEMIQLMKDVSAEGDGKIDFPQFLRLVARSKIHIDRGKRLREAFQIMDPKLTGYIPANELRFTLINIGEILTDEQVDLMIPQLDINDNGMVYYEDIVQLLARKEEDEEDMMEEEEETEAESVYKRRVAVECSAIQIESSSSGLLEQFIKGKEEEIKEKARKQEAEWDLFMDPKQPQQKKEHVETRDVGV